MRSAILIAALAMIDGPAMAQTVCAPRAHMLDGFKQQYGEISAAVGLAAGGALMEIVASPSGTWSLLLVRPDGVACLIASGTAWKTTDSKSGGI